MVPEVDGSKGCMITLAASIDLSPLWDLKCILQSAGQVDAKSHWLHLFDFSPMCPFKVSAREDAMSHWLHLFDFSPLCVFKCVLKWLFTEDAYSHWLHLFDFSPSLFALFKGLYSLKSLSIRF